ncbi:MAG: PVC-type heme-binding CxxCH protein [Planctomycetaceae bacterium]
MGALEVLTTAIPQLTAEGGCRSAALERRLTLLKQFIALWGLVVFPAVSIHAAEQTPGPLSAEEAARQAVLPPGFGLQVFASEPEVVQPVSFCLDDAGRVFVAEALNYGEWRPTGRDRVTVLTDRDGDGRSDERRVFYEGFNYITGIEVGFGGIWVVSPPGLYFVPDRDHDLVPDGPPELLFDGFGHKESRHNLVNGFTWGPDGWLYGGHGRTSPSDVGRPGTPADERIHCDGGVYRIHPTRLVFENFADGTTNPWGVDFNEVGECFVSNCVNPHLFHMVPGGHYEPWRNRPSSLYAYERLPTIADHLHYDTSRPHTMRGETEAVLALGGGHAHCGTLIYQGGRFPPEYHQSVLMCNVHGRRINRDRLQPRGSGYVATHAPDLMIAADPWFMGVTLKTGPDGNVLVSDWSDTGECHTYNPQVGTGRIYRLCYGDAPTTPPTLDLRRASNEQLVEQFWHENDWFVTHARRLLQERAAKPGWQPGSVVTTLRQVLEDPSRSAVHRLRALWGLHVIGEASTGQLVDLLASGEPTLRSWGKRLLVESPAPTDETVAILARLALGESSPVVRLSLASALQRLPVTLRWDVAEPLMRHAGDESDSNLPLVLWYGIEPLVEDNPGRFLELAGKSSISRLRHFAARRFADWTLSPRGQREFAPLITQMQGANADDLRDWIGGLWAAVRGLPRLPLPANWDDVYSRCQEHADPVVRQQSLEIALAFGAPRAVADLRRQVSDAGLSREIRTRALEFLVSARHPDLPQQLWDALQDPPLREAALRGLATIRNPQVAARILELWPGFTPQEKAVAVQTLSSRVETARSLLNALEEQQIARGDISAFNARQMSALGDREINTRLTALWGAVRATDPRKKERLARYRKVLSPEFLKSADLESGARLFDRLCANCHRLAEQGGAIGPDLTGTNRRDVDYLLQNLVDPSAEVARDYRLSIIETRDGRTVTGIELERSPSRVLLQTDARQVVIPLQEIESTSPSDTSIMPEGQLDQLTEDQVRDLIEFLRKR